MVRGPRVSSSRPFFDFMGIGKGDRGRIGFSLYPGWSCVAGERRSGHLGTYLIAPSVLGLGSVCDRS